MDPQISRGPQSLPMLRASSLDQVAEGDRPTLVTPSVWYCVALPVRLVESELFSGHEGGAFTGRTTSPQAV